MIGWGVPVEDPWLVGRPETTDEVLVVHSDLRTPSDVAADAVAELRRRLRRRLLTVDYIETVGPFTRVGICRKDLGDLDATEDEVVSAAEFLTGYTGHTDVTLGARSAEVTYEKRD